MVLLDQYYAQIRYFVKSLTITNRWFGDTNASQIQTLYELDSRPDARGVAYWIRLAGEYARDDTVMEVVSIDTGEVITFTKTNLAAHPKTAQAYKIGTPFYTALCRQYPTQEHLIQSILYPVAVNQDTLPTAGTREYAHYCGDYYAGDTTMTVVSKDTGETINFTKTNLHGGDHPLTEAYYRFPCAELYRMLRRYPEQVDLIYGIVYPECPSLQLSELPHLSLVGYDSSFLEDAEVYSIVDAVTATITYFRRRWAISEYRFEEYYPSVNWFCLYTAIIEAIKQTRIDNLHTHRVHSYHVWEYLMSCGLEDYRSVLSREQTMFLYRNFNYLHEHRGSAATLTKLATGLLDPINATLRSKIIMTNTTDQASTLGIAAEVISHDITGNATPLQDYNRYHTTLDRLYDQTVDSGLEPEDRTDQREHAHGLVPNSQRSTIPTKVMEIQRSDRDRRQYDRYLQCLVDTFLTLWSQGSMTGTLTLDFPALETNLSLTYGEIFALINYLFSFGPIDENEELVDGPTDIIPTRFLTELAFVGDPVIPEEAYVPDVGMVNIRQLVDPTTVTELLDELPDSITSGSELVAAVDTQYDALMFCDQLVHATADAHRFHVLNAIRRAMVGLEWGETGRWLELDDEHPLVANLTEGTYSEWFASSKPLTTIVAVYCETPDLRMVLLDRLFPLLFPWEESLFCGGYEVTAEQYAAFKRLFVKLCSYQIAFIDTDLTPVWQFTLHPILAGFTGCEQTLNLEINLNTNTAYFDDMVLLPDEEGSIDHLNVDRIIGVLTLP